MDRLSDCVLLSVFYRCPVSTFLSKRFRDKAYRLRRWISVQKPDLYLNKYKKLDSMSIATLNEWDFMLLSQSLTSCLLTLNTGRIDNLSALQLVKRCPNLTTLSCSSTHEPLRRGYLADIPQSVTRLNLPTWCIQDLKPGLRQEDLCPIDHLPLLTDCNVPTCYITSISKYAEYTIQDTAEATVASPTLEHLVMIDALMDIMIVTPATHVITLLCPQLAKLRLDMMVTQDNVNSIVLSCPLLTSLSITLLDTEFSTLKKLKLEYLQVSGQPHTYACNTLRTSDLPSTLTHLDIHYCSTLLDFEESHPLPSLLVLKCQEVTGILPMSLRKLRCSHLISIKNIPLVSLHLDLRETDSLVELPDSLTKLKYHSWTIRPKLPLHLPTRLRILRLWLAYEPVVVPETWSFASLQYVSCGRAQMSARQTAEKPRRTKPVVRVRYH